jgi:hypothetical protein
MPGPNALKLPRASGFLGMYPCANQNKSCIKSLVCPKCGRRCDHRQIRHLGEGFTPLVPLERLGKQYGFALYLKDEGVIPTGSFKARGAAVGKKKSVVLGKSDAPANPVSYNL